MCPRPRLREASIPGGRSPRPVRRLISKARRLALKKSKSASSKSAVTTTRARCSSDDRRSHQQRGFTNLDRKSSVDFMRPSTGEAMYISMTPRLSHAARGALRRGTRARVSPFGYRHLLARGPRNKRLPTPSVDTTPPPLTLRPTGSLRSALYQLPPFSRSMAKKDSGACALSSAPASVPMA